MKIEPDELFRKGGSPRNVREFDKDEFITRVIDELFERIHASLRYDMEKVLSHR